MSSRTPVGRKELAPVFKQDLAGRGVHRQKLQKRQRSGHVAAPPVEISVPDYPEGEFRFRRVADGRKNIEPAKAASRGVSVLTPQWADNVLTHHKDFFAMKRNV
jgi:hypothetical protein